MNSTTVSIAIPTYQRDQVLINTLEQLLTLEYSAIEVLVIDQTLQHGRETEYRLRELSTSGRITWIRREQPSITGAMNHALKIANGEVILFLDDDVELNSEIVAEHIQGYESQDVSIIAGQVIQRWQSELSKNDDSYVNGDSEDPDAFLFNSGSRCWISRFMGGNFSIRKKVALDVGGFDENFTKVAYRFEAEFSDRLLSAGHRILFQPSASIRHLKVASGGTRSFGGHLNTISPAHSVGRYYYLLVTKGAKNRIRRIVLGPLRAVCTRFHLHHPWWIPATLLAEILGVVWATFLYIKGPKYLYIA